MTVETPGEGKDVVPYDDSMVGLEDIGVTDIIIPRLRIIHDEGVFEDNLSKARYSKLTTILLGLVKQRIMWDSEVDEGDKPMCKSPDFEHGFPNLREDVPKDKRFPWEKSNFNPSDYPPEKGLNGMVTLPCANCIFKEWDKQGWKNPPCAEQHTYPLMYSPDEGSSWVTALLTLQKTGIKPSRQYISSFAQTKMPAFTVFTEISLQMQSRGSVKYAVPVLRRLGPTDRDQWGQYGDSLRSIREFLRQPPRRQDDDEEDHPTESTESDPWAKTEPAPEAEEKATVSAPAETKSTSAVDDDLPF